MTKQPIERLTARHRDCLQLVATNHSSKEIALKLALSPNTVDGYISEAREILGASSRRDAARIFLDCANEETPQNSRGMFSRVAPSKDTLSIPESRSEDPLREAASSPSVAGPAMVGPSARADSFHWFRGNREHNTLTSSQRLLWISVASLFAAMIFLVALNIIDTLARLLAN
jgi:DNA-binding CsgD family transcriptional regulator